MQYLLNTVLSEAKSQGMVFVSSWKYIRKIQYKSDECDIYSRNFYEINGTLVRWEN